MKNIIKMALGNIWNHKVKTIILGLLVSFGVMIVVIGMGFLEATRNGVEKDFRANYSGDVVIHGPNPKKGTVTLFGVQETVSVGAEIPKTPALPDTQAVLSALDEFDGIKDSTALISGIILLSPAEADEEFEPNDEDMLSIPYGFVFAGDDSYFSVFPDIKIVEGEMYNKNEPSLILDKTFRENFEKYYRTSLNVGDMITIQNAGQMNAKLREARVTGFFEHPDPNTMMSRLCYMDENTARALLDLTFGSVYARDLPPVVDTTLSSMSEEDLFFSDDLFEVSTTAVMGTELSEYAVDSLLGDTSLRDKLNEVADGAWQFVVLKLDRPDEAPELIEKLNAYFTEHNMNVKAIDWRTASSSFVLGTDMLDGMFRILILILSIVVFIVIMNTLIVSVIERTSEIGTMRALGANRGFIRKLIFTETTCIVVIASFVGVFLALVVSGILNISNIQITGETAKMFLGGGRFHITPTLGSIFTTCLAIFVGASFAKLYPVSFALKITPLMAMNQQD